MGEDPELHHPLRNGRPPILLSKKGHNLIEQNNQINSSGISDDDSGNNVWNTIKEIRTKKSQSWVQLKEGCNAIITGGDDCRPGAKSFANVVIRDTGLSASDILEIIDNKGL